ncbi:MAG TPA: major tail protein [Desulfitobacteriaceae bacterium]|nr:major tail protein [Desulfitobacteriaceae bacterium]
MPIVGVEKVYIAPVTTDTVDSLVFGTPVYYEGIKRLGIKPKQSTEKLYAEDKLWDQKTTFDSADVDIELADMTSAQRVTVLGQTTASEGGVYASSDDEAPYVAILYKAPLRVGYRYGVIYKGAFEIPDDSMDGQEGKVKFQTPKLKGTFQTLKKNGMWEYHVDTTDPNCPENIEDTWFDAVVVPSADTTPPTVATSPLDGATDVAISANMVWTFNEAIDSGKVTAANFFLLKASDGNLVAGALSLDGTGKIVTLNPTNNLDAGAAYIGICTTNVTDLAGNALVAIEVTNFTTAS